MNKKPANNNPTKEFFHLLKNIGQCTKYQASIKSYNPDDIRSFIVEISPKRGLYQHAKFLFQFQLVSYPREFPNVVCLSDIYHPNIEYGEDYHNVCLNLFDNWNKSFGLIDVIQGLIFLFYQPNISDPISTLFNGKNTNEYSFKNNVHKSLHGGVVDGVTFLPNPGILEYEEKLAMPGAKKSTDKCVSIDTISIMEDTAGIEFTLRTHEEDTVINQCDIKETQTDIEEVIEEKESIDDHKDVEKHESVYEKIEICQLPAIVSMLESEVCPEPCSEESPVDAVVKEESGTVSVNSQSASAIPSDCSVDHRVESMINNNAVVEAPSIDGDQIRPVEDEEEREGGLFDVGDERTVRNLLAEDSEALYSDLVCSRFLRPDVEEEDEEDDDDYLHDVDDLYCFSPADCNFFDYSNDDEDDDDEDDEYWDCGGESDLAYGMCYDHYLDHLHRGDSRLAPFLDSWRQMRRRAHLQTQPPPVVTHIVLTNLYNPFSRMYGTFVYDHSSVMNVEPSGWRLQGSLCLLNWLGLACRRLHPLWGGHPEAASQLAPGLVPTLMLAWVLLRLGTDRYLHTMSWHRSTGSLGALQVACHFLAKPSPTHPCRF